MPPPRAALFEHTHIVGNDGAAVKLASPFGVVQSFPRFDAQLRWGKQRASFCTPCVRFNR
jgi:hypothetical protein